MALVWQPDFDSDVPGSCLANDDQATLPPLIRAIEFYLAHDIVEAFPNDVVPLAELLATLKEKAAC